MIPRIIHQTWRDAAIPEQFAGYAESWRRFHPNWDFRLWTDADLAELVEARFPAWAPVFHAYPKAIMRADLGRYLVLAAFGGIYADLDAEALRSWDEAIAGGQPILAEEPASQASAEFVRARGFRRLVSNAVIASPPDHPFWNHLLALMHRCRHAGSPLDATGPFVLTAAIDSAPAAIRPEILPARMTSPVDKFGRPTAPGAAVPGAAPLAQHHWAGTWWRGMPVTPLAPTDTHTRMRLTWQARCRDLAARIALAKSLRAARRSVDATQPAGDTVLVAVPVRDAGGTLDKLFAALLSLDHPKHRMALAFLEGDSADDSADRLAAFVRAHGRDYRRVELLRRNFGTPQYARRWEPALQRERRAHLARLRNLLVRRALRDEAWVLWVDADVVALPRDLVGTLIGARARVVHPNCVKAPGGPSFDGNAWIVERAQTVEAMRGHVIDGLYQPPAGHERLYLSDLRYRDRVMLDSVGATTLLVDAALHRAGIGFPEAPYRLLIETEGFAAILRDHGIGMAGLPNVEVIHADA